MKILFNLISCSLGNNGGSLTLIKSANTLQELGHDVKIIDSGRNDNIWEVLKVPHIVIKNLQDVPSADVVIATGYKTVKSTLELSKKCGLKCHWIRAFELWNFSEKDIVEKIFKAPTVKIVNSICLQSKLKQFGMSSTIIRPGYDFGDYFPIDMRGPRVMVLGGLYSEGEKRKYKRVQWIFETFKQLKEKFRDLQLFMYGSDGFPNNKLITSFYRNPSILQKNMIYNNISIWLSPSELEGLHIVPAEAMLTEAAVVTTNVEMSGTQDYVINNETGIVSGNNLDSFILHVEQLIRNNEKRKQLGEKGREKILSLGDRTTNMIKFIDLLQNLKGD